MAEQLTHADVVDSPPFTLSFAYAKRQHVIVKTKFSSTGKKKTIVYCCEGVEPLTLAELSRVSPTPLFFEAVDKAEFEKRLHTNYEQGGNQRIENIELGDDVDLLSVAQQLAEPEDLLESEDDAPIIRLINAILAEAIKENASDIHIEPFEQRLVVRLRVDGLLREVIQPPRELASLLVSRIKVMAQLDIAEKRIPQDGRISLKLAGKAIDVRVSTLPTGGGERVVLRLLDNQAGRLSVKNMGMDQSTQALIKALIVKPHGIILVTGPTGSGKTTTLYAVLTELNNHKRNLITVEDPIEYYLEGVGQTQVNNKVDMTFARGLRAILRQDPDVVMVGEIRDSETADIAVQASLTGNMVLSTLHTNTAVGSITRLRDMGVEPFLLSSSLVAVIAQRLVRVLCPVCRQAYQPSDMEKHKLNIESALAVKFYHATGCPACNQQGYKGRTGVYELLIVDDEIRHLIHDDASEQAIEQHARKKTPSIQDDGARLVLKGITSTDEIFRVLTHSD
ncbi:MAG: type II secretion system ATPase GspE [gamma proteobacterium symbiont of Bathyaustriella thionipta]|nr:type II secretion system ATPase GspE [gamma proteobacterium symbiont of Bathyaustriella thionipta]MCU7968047.1 type II secretion system ATPase GspE [gamma proteobacterium symbiont of Bathyaustriella thionipta]